MTWKVELEAEAAKELRKLDREAARRITKFLSERLAARDDPRSIGEPLKGSRLGDLWKYRVGDFRIIASIEDARLVVLVVRVGNRKEVYRA